MPSARHLDAVLGQCVKHDVIHETGSTLAYGIFVRQDGTAKTENVPRIIQLRSDVFFGMREYKKSIYASIFISPSGLDSQKKK